MCFTVGTKKSRDDALQDVDLDSMQQNLQAIGQRLESLEMQKRELLVEQQEINSMIVNAKKRKHQGEAGSAPEALANSTSDSTMDWAMAGEGSGSAGEVLPNASSPSTE